MTFRASLARYLKGVLEETSPPTSSPPQQQNPESTPTTTTTTTTTSEISAADTLSVVLGTLAKMQTEQLRETREMVLSILQGRPMDPETTRQVEPQPSRTPFDPPDYDHPGIEDLPGSLQSVFEREDSEQDTLRALRTEREVLSQQLDQARAALADPQGPASGLFLSTD